MLRKSLLQRYVDLQEVEEILGHNSIIYFRGVVSYCLLLFLVYVGYAVWHTYTPELYVTWIAGVVGLLLFFRWLFVFLNLYLDCLLFSHKNIIVFLRDGLLQYRTEIFEWNKIAVVSYRQDSIFDKLFNKGDLLIQLGGIDFTFNDVYAPKKCVAKILLYKKRFEEDQSAQVEKDLENDQRNFDVMVNALGEIIKDYLNK